MRIIILFNGDYPGFGAASRRVENYEKGLKLQDNIVEVIPFKLKIKIQFLSLLLGWIMPFYVFFRLFYLKITDSIVMVYGFGWMSKLMIILYSKINKLKVIFEVNEKPYSLIGGSKRDVIVFK